MKTQLRFLFGLFVTFFLGFESGSTLAAGSYVSPAKQTSDSPDVGIDGQGNAFFSWTTFDPVTQFEVIQLRERTAAGALGITETLSKSGHDAMVSHVAVSGDGAAVVVWQIHHGDANATTPVQARARSTAGVLGPIFAVAPHPGGMFSFDFANPNVVLDSAGNATFSWIGLDSSQKHRAYARRRSAGGVFSPAFALSPTGVSTVGMAASSGGDTDFVWVWNDGLGHNLLQARRLSSAGTLGPTKTIAQGLQEFSGNTFNPQVAMDANGNALIAWEQPDGQGNPAIIARTFSNSDVVGSIPQTLTPTTSGGVSPRLAMDNAGNVVVTWLHNGLELRSRASDGTLGPVGNFTTSADAAEPVLRGEPSGKTVALWTGASAIQARARSAAGALGPPHSYSISGQSAFGGVVSVGAGGHAIIAWGQSDGLGQCFGGSSCNRVGAAVGP